MNKLLDGDEIDFYKIMEHVERKLLKRAISKYPFSNKAGAAYLNIPRTTFVMKLRKHKLLRRDRELLPKV